MTDAIKTSDVPPSIALARMAWKLSWFRSFNTWANYSMDRGPVPREDIESMFPASAEYYAIIDRISAGEAP